MQNDMSTLGDFIEGWLYTRIDDPDLMDQALRQAETYVHKDLLDMPLTDGVRQELIGALEGDPDNAPTLRSIIADVAEESGNEVMCKQADAMAEEWPKNNAALQAMRVGPDTPLPAGIAKAIRHHIDNEMSTLTGSQEGTPLVDIVEEELRPFVGRQRAARGAHSMAKQVAQNLAPRLGLEECGPSYRVPSGLEGDLREGLRVDFRGMDFRVR
jgi:hypothetical protein